MAQGKLAIKQRIRSIDSTKKITKAMQLVAAGKLQKQKQYMEENREYAYYLKETITDILSSLPESEHPYLAKRDGKSVTVVFTSDMGLCGGYNANVLRMLEKEIGNDTDIIMLGSRGVNWINRRDFQMISTSSDLEDDCYNELSIIADDLLKKYRDLEIASIRILYTKFINSVSFEPTCVTLLPIEETGKAKDDYQEVDFEPSGDQILDTIVPMYLRSLLYSYFLETKTSEQASRRMAMESATDNAEEIRATLELQFNQARQAAITQEITEIVGGVNALE